MFPELRDHERPRQANASINPPNASMADPQYRLTLASVRAARASGARNAIASRMTPISAKNAPVGIRRSSMSGKPEVQNQSQRRYRNGHRHGPFKPARVFVVLEPGQSVHQAFEFRISPGPRHQAHQNRHHE